MGSFLLPSLRFPVHVNRCVQRAFQGHKEGGPSQRRKDPGNEKGSVEMAQSLAHLKICRERRQMELGGWDGASRSSLHSSLSGFGSL